MLRTNRDFIQTYATVLIGRSTQWQQIIGIEKSLFLAHGPTSDPFPAARPLSPENILDTKRFMVSKQIGTDY